MKILDTLRRIFKLSLCIAVILIYLVIASLVHLFGICFRRWCLRILSQLNRFLNRFFRCILGIKVMVENKTAPPKQNGIFIISNHTTYIDGIVLGSLFPIVYVSKREVKSWPLFGQMVFLAGTIFIDRTRKDKTAEFVQQIAGVLNKKINVLLFPEGTSTDGKMVLLFQSAFFAAPFISKSAILPVSILYTHINNEPLSNSNKDKVYWYGSRPFFNHLWKFLGLKQIVVNIRISPAIEPLNFKDDSSGRKQLSSYCHEIISQQLKNISS